MTLPFNSSSPVYACADIRKNPGMLGTSWENSAFNDLCELLTPVNPNKGAGFPCILGLIAFQKEFMKVSFYESLDNQDSLKALGRNLACFSDELSKERSVESHKYSTFLAIFHTGSKNFNVDKFAQAAKLLWDLLQYLHDHDPIPWPPDAVKNVNDVKFQYRYHGQRFFPLYFSPLHEYLARKTKTFMILFQPTEIFNFHREHTEHFKKIQTETHKRIERYTDEPPQFYTLDYGTVYETMQYLGEHQKNFKAEEWNCPLAIK